MKNIINNLIRSAALAALITGTAALARGAEKGDAGSPNTPAATAPAGNARSYPLRGTVGTTDPAAQTVLLAGKKSSRLVHVDASTQLSRDGKPIAVGDLQTGDYLKGLVMKNEGRETLLKATVGEQPESSKHRASRPARKSAKMASADSSAHN